MAKRQFLIYLGKAEWSMGVVGYDYRKDSDGKRILPKKITAPKVTSKEGKITRITSTRHLSEEEFKALERDEAFQEVCDFTDMDPESGEVLKTFEGTIIHSLRYANQTFGAKGDHLRNFEIAFYEIEWHIALFYFDEKKHDDKNDFDIISPMVTSKEGKITYIVDVFPPNEDQMEAVKPHKAFYETCRFTHINEWTGEIIKTFTGTFIDAMRYIQEVFVVEEHRTPPEGK